MCHFCGKISGVVNFNRDDPVLECNHVQPCRSRDKAAEEMEEEMLNLIRKGYTVWDAIVAVTYGLEGEPEECRNILNARLT